MLTFLKKYRIILIVLTLLLTSGIVYGSINSSPAEEVEEKYAKVTKGNVSVSLSVDGKSMIDKRELTFEVGGIVRGVSVKEGQKVTAWKTLAYLDTREAQKNLQNEMKDYLIQRNDFEEMGQVTYPDVPVISATIKRILEKNQWNLEKSVLDVELKELAIKKSYLSSPIAGTVVDISIKPGELAATNKIAITVVDENTMIFESYVEDVEALKIKEDMVARIVFDALPDDSFMGYVVFVSPVATIDENELSMYKILINFEETETALLDGMAGEVEIISKEVTDVLKIPNSTVKREDGKSIVYVKKDEKVEKREVKLGFTNGKDVEVKEGLIVGETLIDWK